MVEANEIPNDLPVDIKPTLLIVRKENLKDTPEVRRGYDPRIIPPPDLPEEVAHFYLFDFFNFSPDDKASEDKIKKLRVVHDWGKRRAESHDPFKVIDVLRRLEARMGQPELGCDRLTHMYKFTKIAMIVDDLEKERDSYLR